ncbi:glycosyltransferase family 4 protein [Ectothiorhodospiraceae bacterium 2226]|nr:glycosyltransferase family 4 protein [Ectothiorhodospiraceae bacterium 2226]
MEARQDGFAKPRVLMIGVHPERTPGGIAAVYALYRRGGLSNRVSLRYRWSQLEGRLPLRLAVAVAAALRIGFDMLFWRPDVVHLMVAANGSFFRKSVYLWMARLLGRRTLFHMHASSFQEFYAGLPRWARGYVRATLARTEVIALSPSWGRFYAELRGTRRGVHVLGNPVAIPPLAADDVQASEVQLVFLGRVGERKGAWDLIGALAQLRAVPGWRAYIAGDGDLDKARALVREHGLEERVEICGWIDREGVERLLGKPSIVVLPSYREGLPVALLQGMAHGHPVVSTHAGGIPDLVEHGRSGYLVAPGAVAELAAALRRLIGDAPRRARMGAYNRRRVERAYALPLVVDDLVALYGVEREVGA